MDHRHRRSPIALTGNSPIAQLVGDGSLSESVRLSIRGHPANRLGRSEIGELTRMNENALPLIGSLVSLKKNGMARFVHRSDDLTKGKTVLPGEFKIALIVRRNGHDRACAVVHEDEIGDPDGQAFPIEGIAGKESRINTFFLRLSCRTDAPIHLSHPFDEPGDVLAMR